MRQRVAIAIALSCEPKLLIADEPTTALDVTIQAQILDLLAREQRRRHMAMILITHDLGVVAGRTDEVAVMYAGRVVERAPTAALFKTMRMPYTEALLAAIPKLDAAPHTPLPAIPGRPPDPTRPMKGCAFSPRCRYAAGRCFEEKPPLAAAESADHQYACFHPLAAGAGVDARRRRRLHRQRPIRCCGSKTWWSNMRSAARPFMRSPASACRWRAARRWGWSANPAAASPRSAARCCSCASRSRAACCSTART
jgi:oligopeptide/dipeptide ABC transporter ATP-binding protein